MNACHEKNIYNCRNSLICNSLSKVQARYDFTDIFLWGTRFEKNKHEFIKLLVPFCGPRFASYTSCLTMLSKYVASEVPAWANKNVEWHYSKLFTPKALQFLVECENSHYLLIFNLVLSSRKVLNHCFSTFSSQSEKFRDSDFSYSFEYCTKERITFEIKPPLTLVIIVQ